MVTANSWVGGGHQGPDGPRNQETERKRECQEQTCRAGAAWGEQGYAAASAPALTHSGLCPDTSEWRAIYGISHLTTPPPTCHLLSPQALQTPYWLSPVPLRIECVSDMLLEAANRTVGPTRSLNGPAV